MLDLAHCDFLTQSHEVHIPFQEAATLPKQGVELSFWHGAGDTLSDLE